ncbi:Rne/Rng family ribonuclease [Marinovum algicola]|uniref:Rne/Rng family ribonuclease n=1 Tax=Marinovum algicola TaxID=42444 RepID=UPI0024B8AB50|nr:ribonuclease E/G [Marinovum algicola]
MAKKMLIDATHAEETRVVVVDGNKVEEFDFESENKRQLAGNIYLAKVTRVEPSLQAAFVDYGGNRHGFLAFSEIHPDYYQIPVADREALMEEERAYAEAMKARDEEEAARPKKRRRRSASKAEKTANTDAIESREVEGMETIDLGDGEDTLEGLSPMATVAETPVEEPEGGDAPEAEAAETAPAADAAQAEETVDAADPQSDTPADEAEEAPEAADVSATETAADDTAKTGDAPEVETEDDEDETPAKPDAADKDSDIESVADDDDQEDIRPPRKPRPRRYKIQEVIKVRQILLVQVVKEERGNKGAALTTYLSLAGRYCVLMPNTARGGGISRKITNAPDRKKLKEIANEIDVPQGAGLIIRTAGAKRTKSEIKRDYEYLQRLWEQIRELTLKSIAPAKIYEEGDLIKRSIRDLYSRDIDEVLVEGERGYRIAKDFMKMIMPSHAKNVKQYGDQLPLFARYQVESYLGAMFNPTVQLKSGGYIVIGVTEALVAIDVNSGRATKEGSIEETALKTNLEAAEEVARQLRLRDLAGLIVIDFIDMDERKNNAAVEKKLKDKLKTDRARIQVGRISGFGLMEMSRQRLRPGMIEATTAPCPHCHGTGLIRSDDSLALQVLRQIEEEGTRRRCKELLVRCPVTIANYLMNAKREHIAMIEARYGIAVRVEGDPALVSPDFTIEKLKTATRKVAEAPVVSADTKIMDLVDEDTEEPEEEAQAAEEAPAETPETGEEETPKPKKRRRRRRRRKSKSDENNGDGQDGSDDDNGDKDANGDKQADGDKKAKAPKEEAEASPADEESSGDKPKRTRRTSSSRRKSSRAKTEETGSDETAAPEAQVAEGAATEAAEAPAEVSEAPAAAPEPAAAAETPEATEAPAAEAEPAAEAPADTPAAEAAPAAVDAPAEASQVDEVAEAPATEPEAPIAEDAPVAEDAPAAEPVQSDVAAEPEAQPEPEAPAEPEQAEAETPEPATAKAEPVLETADVAQETEVEDPDKPKKRGWWSIGR